ncbi:hypothetical protein K435DRAFT_873570 [Dendrothele bispora CBS 962.96]|uniref:Uncharacterized protein n=1 Tax=Dendrothele bispora (strain CBS 962.96) TaxID=1314807 RepID=A0A4S8KYU3_DENBC|nr:hypothetical protein K435DRAFT_873570 [Dendrothele bispora CBS 962.96]
MLDTSPSKTASFIKELSEDVQDLAQLLTKKKSPKIIEAQAKLVSMTPTDITHCSSSDSAFSVINEGMAQVNAATTISGTTKARQIVEDEEDASGDEDVEVVEKVAATKGNKTVTRSATKAANKDRSTPEPSAAVEQDVQMANNTKGKNTPAHAATVSIPYSDVLGMDTSSKSYHNAEYYLAQASKASKSSQQVRSTHETSSAKHVRASEYADTHTPDSHDAERTSGTHAHKVLNDVAMLPFTDMNSKTTDSLKAITNFLALTSEESLFQIQRAWQDYLSHQEVALGVEELQEVEGGPSGSELHSLMEVIP